MSKLIALETCVEQTTGLRFKLQVFGMPVCGPANVLNDNESAAENSLKLESALNKRHGSMTCHLVSWSAAAEVIKVEWVMSESSLADALTKRLPSIKRDKLFGYWTCQV